MFCFFFAGTRWQPLRFFFFGCCFFAVFWISYPTILKFFSLSRPWREMTCWRVRIEKKQNKRKTQKKNCGQRKPVLFLPYDAVLFNFFLFFLTVSIFCSVLSQLQRRFLVFFSFIFDTFLLMTLQIKNSLWRMKRFAIRLRDGPSLIFTLVFVLTRFSSSYNWWSGDFHRLNLVLPG